MDWTHRLRLRNLQVLVCLADTRNISHCATLLNTTQPGLSKWLKDLEADIGLPLFERHARGLRPTPHGEALLAHARRVLGDLDRARDEMTALREGSSGHVVIGASGAAAVSTAPAAVLALLDTMPNARVEVVEGLMDSLMDKLARGDIDIAVGRSSPEYRDAAFQAEDLYRTPLYFVARAGHPLVERRSLGWDDLRAYRWVMWPRNTPARDALELAMAKAGQDMPAGCLQSNSVLVTFSLLAGSDMLAVASEQSVAYYEKLNALRRLPFEFDAFGTVAMYWRHDGFRSAAVEATLASLRQVCERIGEHGNRSRAS